jgi:hypothetical protein
MIQTSDRKTQFSTLLCSKRKAHAQQMNREEKRDKISEIQSKTLKNQHPSNSRHTSPQYTSFHILQTTPPSTPTLFSTFDIKISIHHVSKNSLQTKATQSGGWYERRKLNSVDHTNHISFQQ